MKSAPEIQPPGLHPRFHSSIPTLVETAHKTRNNLRPVMEGAASLVAEVRDYLRFEIDKVVVAIQKAEWEGKVDLTKLKAHRDELKTFQDWLDRFDIQQPFATLGVIVDALESLEKEHPP